MKTDTALRSAQTIILTPTHELAVQVYRQACLLAENSGLDVRSALVIGDAGLARQLEKLKEKTPDNRRLGRKDIRPDRKKKNTGSHRQNYRCG